MHLIKHQSPNKKNSLLKPGIFRIIFLALSIATDGNTCQYRQKFQAKSSIEMARINHLNSGNQTIEAMRTLQYTDSDGKDKWTPWPHQLDFLQPSFSMYLVTYRCNDLCD